MKSETEINDICYITLGEELYNSGKETFTSQNSTNTNTISPLFEWTNTHIQNIPDVQTRDLCIVMFQAMNLTKSWDILQSKRRNRSRSKLIFDTMRNLGYNGELNGREIKLAIQTMKKIKEDGGNE
jgi:hypothetical protein